MTHEQDDGAGLADVVVIDPPVDVEVEPIDGVPVGDLSGVTVDYDPAVELEKGLKGPEPGGLADPVLQVVVQMGHVARTTGRTGTAGEQDFARAAAAHTAGQLSQDGRTVKVVGADEEIPRSEIFVAIHCDGHTNTNAKGASVGYRNNKGKKAAEAWKAAYQSNGWNRGFRQDNLTVGLSDYYGNRKANNAGTPFAFILEAGFLTNPEDKAMLANDEGHLRVAKAIRDTVNQLLNGAGQQGAPPFPGVLRKGAQGPDVCKVQERLRALGHSIDRFPHCPFGPQTESAVKSFQQSKGLAVAAANFGAVDETTWQALFS